MKNWCHISVPLNEENRFAFGISQTSLYNIDTMNELKSEIFIPSACFVPSFSADHRLLSNSPLLRTYIVHPIGIRIWIRTDWQLNPFAQFSLTRIPQSFILLIIQSYEASSKQTEIEVVDFFTAHLLAQWCESWRGAATMRRCGIGARASHGGSLARWGRLFALPGGS